jgi:hypothetical protein
MAITQSNEQETALTAEQKAILKKVAKLMPEAKVFEPKEKGNYYGPIVYADKKNVVQQVGDNTVVAHPRAGMTVAEGQGLAAASVVSVKYDADLKAPSLEGAEPDRWKERTARTQASPEHTAIARVALGEKVGVYAPPSQAHGLSPKYDGVVAAVTDTHLVQRINSRTAIVHDVGAEIAKQYAAGQQVSVSYDNGKLKAVEAVEHSKSQERTAARQERPERSAAAPARDPDDAARAKSWVLARNLVNKSYGSEAKIYSAQRVDADAGKFRGPIVAVTDHHVVQRVGKGNSFVSHSRDNLTGIQPQPGRFVQVNYDKGVAQVHEARTQQQQQQQQRPAPERPLPSRSQGMSR